MSTSENSTVSFDTKCDILSAFLLEGYDTPLLTPMVNATQLDFDMAFMTHAKLVVPTELGAERIEALWKLFIQETIGDEYHGPLESLDDIIYWSKSGLFPQEEVDRVTDQGHMI